MTDDAPDSLIPYDEIVQEALRAIPGRVLRDVERSGALPGNHHFYITFKTQAPGVALPSHLIAKFPDEMTIVLQHKFWDLKVTDVGFEGRVDVQSGAGASGDSVRGDPLLRRSGSQFQPGISGAGRRRRSEPHEEAENDSPEAEDGSSNVVTVDFGKKK